MAKASKHLANNDLVETALDIGDQNREKATKLQTFDLSYFISKSYVDDDGSQNHLMCLPIFKAFKIFAGSINKSFG